MDGGHYSFGGRSLKITERCLSGILREGRDRGTVWKKETPAQTARVVGQEDTPGCNQTSLPRPGSKRRNHPRIEWPSAWRTKA